MEQQPKAVEVARKAGAGAYTEVTGISAPASAIAGSLVQIQITIKNKYSSEAGIMARAVLEYGVTPWPVADIPNYWANVPAGQSYSFVGSFTMPAYAVIIHGYSYYYGSGGTWHFDDEKTKNVSLGEQEAVFNNLSVAYRRV